MGRTFLSKKQLFDTNLRIFLKNNYKTQTIL